MTYLAPRLLPFCLAEGKEKEKTRRGSKFRGKEDKPRSDECPPLLYTNNIIQTYRRLAV